MRLVCILIKVRMHDQALNIFFIERYDQAYKEQLNDLAKLFRSNLRPKSGFIDGKISIQIAESAIRSLKSKKFEKIKY